MFYQPVQENRWFRPNTLYSQIDWNDFSVVVGEFRGRLDEWYINPAHALQKLSGHFNFAVTALCCLLIDTLSQFHGGEQESRATVFKAFLRQQLPEFAGVLPQPIQIPAPRQSLPHISDFAEALYHAFRCGILHQAHITPFGMLGGQPMITSFQPSGYTRYVDGSDCPSVVIDPGNLLEALEKFLDVYVAQLLDPNPEFDQRRVLFKQKFTASFGVDIMNAA